MKINVLSLFLKGLSENGGPRRSRKGLKRKVRQLEFDPEDGMSVHPDPHLNPAALLWGVVSII